MIWIWLVIIVIVIVIFRRKFYSFQVGTLNGFVGGNGTGKTFCATWLAVKTFRRRWRATLFANMRRTVANWFRTKKRKKPLHEMPILVSNIPMRIPWHGKSYKLLPEHLLLKERLPQRSVILIDEHGQWCSQFGYNNPNAINNGAYDEFLRLCRHYGDFAVFVCEQCSENIIFSCRRRLQSLNNMMGISFFSILPIFVARVRTVSVSEEIKTVETGMDGASSRLVIGLVPFRPLYDSRSFSGRYDTVPAFRWRRYKSDTMKTNTVITCPYEKVFADTKNEDD
ncbi:MAG: hypothetical protein IJ009_07760 [Clostridia bacterium]|nr:hypothetical protein [Clostridia bacterium]